MIWLTNPSRLFGDNRTKLTPNSIVLADDFNMRKSDSNKLMFNVVRLLIFKPIPVSVFLERCYQNVEDMQKNSEDNYFNYSVSFEIVEGNTGTPAFQRHLPVLSRFSNAKKLHKFIIKNHLYKLKFYQIRMVLAHFVADCFLYRVRSMVASDLTKVSLEPLSYFSCQKTSLGRETLENAQNVYTHIPQRIMRQFPFLMLSLQMNAIFIGFQLCNALKPTNYLNLSSSPIIRSPKTIYVLILMTRTSSGLKLRLGYYKKKIHIY